MPISKNPAQIIEEALSLLKQQRELYGAFEVTSVVPHQSNDISVNEVRENYNTNAAITDKKTIQPQNKTSVSDLIASCSTLDELRALCETATILRTDLEGTNLVFGVGNPDADLMIVGEAPGLNEDKQGEPFVGRAGQLLDKIMEAIHLQRGDIYIANILKHRPPDNRDPKPEERLRSLPFLLRQIELVNPKLILCVGRISAATLLQTDSSLKDLRQKFHPFRGRELMVTYHPAALLRNPHWKRPTWEDVQLLRKRYDELGCRP